MSSDKRVGRLQAQAMLAMGVRFTLLALTQSVKKWRRRRRRRRRRRNMGHCLSVRSRWLGIG